MRPRHFLSVVLAATLWGFGGITGTLLGDHAGIGPLSIAMWRMLVAGVALLAYLAVRGTLRRLSAAQWRRALLTGTLTAAFEACYFLGISYSSVGLSTLIGIGSAPVFVAAYDWATERRRPPVTTLIALALALGGLALLLSGSLDTGRNGPLGALIALGAGATFAAITVVNRHEVPGLGPVEHTAFAFTFGGLLLVPAAAATGIGAASDGYGWALTIAMGVLITALAYVAYLTGLRSVPPFVATIVALLEPLVAAIAAALIFAERLGPLGIVGGLLLGAAVVLLRPQRDEPESLH
ncbi:DMT family transporter [Demequina lignilytica]|uniref:EamA family transporter n=1 Tax=Demequina lignilytica TaxID=3051663 RepID=A0AB35MFX2_9MICO|nr:EamA family transporter [Demequina sp. SYSU T0a273]MDN4482641.1 EamA family transporter [Demequina sp. SYSU T0a273]